MEPVLLKVADERVEAGRVGGREEIQIEFEVVEKLGQKLLARPLGLSVLAQDSVQALGGMLIVQIEANS